MTAQDRVVKFGSFLLDSHISSISPQMGLLLADILKQVEEAIKTTTDPEILSELYKYKEALAIVCGISLLHQGMVIATLKKAISGRSS